MTEKNTEKTTAQALLEKLMGRKNSVVIDLEGVELKFNRDDVAYDAFFNDVEAKNKLTPMKDYLLTIIDRDQRDLLVQLVQVPDVAATLLAKVNEAFVPKLEAKLKN
ncbi:putative phage tail assembly chaperone [[Pasteurella] aerogenes]